MNAAAVGDWLWQIDHCLGSLDCYTGYRPSDQQPTPEEHWNAHLVRHPVEKRTPKRIYFADGQGPGRRRFIVDRATLEADGKAYCASLRAFVYAAEPPMPAWSVSQPADLKALKAEMAAAHPDVGGDAETFRKARERYVSARGKQ